MIELDWTDFKQFLDDRELSCDYLNSGKGYALYAFDGPLTVYCNLHNTLTSATTDFETNYKSDGNQKRSIHNGVPLTATAGVNDPVGYRARLVGVFNGETCTKTTDTSVDWQIPQLSWQGVNKDAKFDGIEYCAENAVMGDKMKFQVVDKDNLLGYGAGFVLEEFGTDWNVFSGKNSIRLYKGSLIVGMYMRIVYTSVGTTDDVKLYCNLYRHLDERS